MPLSTIITRHHCDGVDQYYIGRCLLRTSPPWSHATRPSTVDRGNHLRQFESGVDPIGHQLTKYGQRGRRGRWERPLLHDVVRNKLFDLHANVFLQPLRKQICSRAHLVHIIIGRGRERIISFRVVAWRIRAMVEVFWCWFCLGVAR